jgi:hypothetical protein
LVEETGVPGEKQQTSSSLDIQYSIKTLKITYCCMRGYLQKYLHKFHESENHKPIYI